MVSGIMGSEPEVHAEGRQLCLQACAVGGAAFITLLPPGALSTFSPQEGPTQLDFVLEHSKTHKEASADVLLI